jgi:3-oxoacyl-[acyl-carrier protein] reductase
MNVQPLTNEIAVVTGASRGIGRAIVLELARRGAVVVGTATTDSGAAAISAALDAQGARGRGAMLNVTEPESVDRFVEDVAKTEGVPTILVNNAGITRDNLLLRMKAEEWTQVLETNLTSVFRVTKACLRGMTKARHGRIINIASVVGASGNAGQTNYVSAKAGMVGFTKALALEVASRGITVNAVAPGFIETDMTQKLTDEQRAALVSRIPLARIGRPEDIACTVAFLAAPEAGYITGATIHVNGGLYLA